MEIPVIIALVISVVALGLGVWALLRKPTVGVMDLEEWSLFPAQIKDMWKKNLTRKLIPAAMEKVNKVWESIPANERQEAAKEAEAQTEYLIKHYNQMYSKLKPEDLEELKAEFYPFVKIMQGQRLRDEARFAAALTQAPVVKQVVTAMVKATKPPPRTVRPRTARPVKVQAKREAE